MLISEEARETAERAQEAEKREAEKVARQVLAHQEAEERDAAERLRAEARADVERAQADTEARIAAIFLERDRVVAEGVLAFDRESTRERLQRGAKHVWVGGAKPIESAPPRVFCLVGMSADSVRDVGAHASQEVTSVEERVAVNMWGNCASE